MGAGGLPAVPWIRAFLMHLRNDHPEDHFDTLEDIVFSCWDAQTSYSVSTIRLQNAPNHSFPVNPQVIRCVSENLTKCPLISFDWELHLFPFLDLSHFMYTWY